MDPLTSPRRRSACAWMAWYALAAVVVVFGVAANGSADPGKDFNTLPVKGMVTKEMVATMAENPIIFAMANPDPEITPEEAHAVREDAIVATGRSDYPNQVNNVLCFPHIFRGALDVVATTIGAVRAVALQRISLRTGRRIVAVIAIDVAPGVEPWRLTARTVGCGGRIESDRAVVTHEHTTQRGTTIDRAQIVV